ncbi:class I SAM-dependent RNA methyltransferase, partial [bacterium]|nr:class I SAM-dependent RNA methyltransferase [bacterium]
MFDYQDYQVYFAKCGYGLEEILARELMSLGAEDTQQNYFGVRFKAGADALYRINYKSRLASHILAPLINFDCHSDNYLYTTAMDIQWESIIRPGMTFAIQSHVTDSRITHSQYAALKLKDAIVDRLRTVHGDRPNVDRKNPDVWLDLNIRENKAIISLDTSKGALHRRGYRRQSVEAPLQETLASAILTLGEWDMKKPLVDPMCGSGTFLSEALLMAQNAPSPAERFQGRSPFKFMPDWDEDVWEDVRNDTDSQMKQVPHRLITGSDINRKAVSAATTNLGWLSGSQSVRIKVADFRDLDGFKDSFIVVNPPFGDRLGERRDALKL